MSETARASLPGSFARLSRGSVHYELSGPEAAPIVVLVSGLSVPYSTWDRNAHVLASAGYRVLRYDHYGRGYTDRPRNSEARAAGRHRAYDLDLYVEQLSELLHALGLARPVVLVGLSMGGAVVAAAATTRTGLARAVVLVDPLCEWPEAGLAPRLTLVPAIGDAIMALFGGRILASGQRGDFFEEGSCREFMPRYLPPLRYRGIERAVLATLRSMPSWPLAETFEALGRSGLPVLAFWGREDATLPYESSAGLLASVPQAEFRCIECAGHVPQWEKAEEVNASIVAFLSRLDPTAPR